MTGQTAFRTGAAAIFLALLATLGTTPVPARGQDFRDGIAASPTGWRTTGGAPRFRVRFHNDDNGVAATGVASADDSPLFRSGLFTVDDALAAATGAANAGGRIADRVPDIAGSAEAFVLELASPQVITLESTGRLGTRGPRYSFTPQGLTLAWPSSKPVNRGSDGFNWNSYLKHNLHMLAWQHGYRILCQEKTRRGLREPLLRQWRDDIRAIPHSWGDGDSFATNYIGHPMMGAVMGYFEVFNHPAHARLEFGDRGYWKARGVTLAAAAVASTQFEIGPLSEATTGLHPSKQGMSDFIVTPLVGAGWIVGEDALDRYVIAKLEVGQGPVAKAILRCALNPSRTLANLFAFRSAWHRDTRAD